MFTPSGSIRRLAAALGLALLLATGGASAQQPTPVGGPGPDDPFQQGGSSFAANDFQASVSAINSLLQNLPKDLPPADKVKLEAGLEPIYFTLGAAYFNLKDYSKATAALKDYLAKYPKGARFADATFSLAQASYFNKDYSEAAKAFAALENNREYREQALLLEGLSFKEAGDLDKAIATLEKLIGGGIKSPNAAQGGLAVGALLRRQAAARQKALKMLAGRASQHRPGRERAWTSTPLALGQGDAFLGDGELTRRR